MEKNKLNKNNKIKERYFLSQDQSSHWYVVPVSKQEEWEEWNDLHEDDPKSWDAPEWATPVGGSYVLVTFTDFEIE
jgi:hypothetical protein